MDFAGLKTLLFARSNFGMKLGLERMFAALKLLGDPHRAAPALHIAGSNGKGSTCAFTEASLRAAGLKTGLYTSPHLIHFCERIRIGGASISEENAASLLEQILARVPWALSGGPLGKDDGDGLTFFELVTLMAFLAFAEHDVEVMVVEVGLGGRLDATNVLEPVACAVAPLALEHTQYLGNTLAAIAFEKAGIIKRGVPVASAGQVFEAAQVLSKTALGAGARLWRPGRDYQFESRDRFEFCYQHVDKQVDIEGRNIATNWTVHLPPPADDAEREKRDPRSGLSLRGHHQRGNAALACALLELASSRGIPVSAEHAGVGLVRASWPGRLQAAASSPLVLLDGAHNPHGAQALARSLPGQISGPVQLVFGALADKDLAQLLAPLLPFAAAVHACAPHTPRALPPEAIRDAVAANSPALSCKIYGSAAAALAGAREAAGRSGAVLGCGSLYLVGELLSAIDARAFEPMPSERLHASTIADSGPAKKR